MKSYLVCVLIFTVSVNALYSMEQSYETRKTLSYDDRSSDTITSLIDSSCTIINSFLKRKSVITDDIVQAMEKDQSWKPFLEVSQEQKNVVLHKIIEHIGPSEYEGNNIAILCAVVAGAYSKDLIEYLFKRGDLYLVNFIIGYRLNRNLALYDPSVVASTESTNSELDDWLIIDSTKQEWCNFL